MGIEPRFAQHHTTQRGMKHQFNDPIDVAHKNWAIPAIKRSVFKGYPLPKTGPRNKEILNMSTKEILADQFWRLPVGYPGLLLQLQGPRCLGIPFKMPAAARPMRSPEANPHLADFLNPRLTWSPVEPILYFFFEVFLFLFQVNWRFSTFSNVFWPPKITESRSRGDQREKPVESLVFAQGPVG
jgi:hypothetical protein